MYNKVVKLNSVNDASTIIGTTGSSPSAITIDNQGNIYTANSASNTVSKITPTGTSTILGTTGDRPIAITLDSQGNIYTANYNSNNVSKITPQGVSTIIGTTGSSPISITIDNQGNIYTANSLSNNVSKLTPSDPFIITALSAGTTTITATANDASGISNSLLVTVTAPIITPTSHSISGN
ncbi:MAG: hypothetical protein ORN26_02630, partial [Candidatus Pacebacteria bacterium]|nr:hypothetical protein [Candidatus Paceibacterota bacterium]